MAAGFVALGLVQGALAGLNAVGLVLLWRTTRVLNLAQPALGLVGGVLTGLLVSAAGWSFWWALPIGVGTGALMGLAAERLVLVRLQHVPRVVLLVATVGLAQLLTGVQTALPFLFGGRLPSYAVDLGVEVFVFPVMLKGAHLLALVALPLAAGVVWWYVNRTRVGIAALAAGQDLERATTLGVPVRFVRAVAWSVAGALSGVAGVLAIPVLGFSLGDGVAPTVLLLAVAPAVLAGLRSIPGAAVAALAVGVSYQIMLMAAPQAGLADLVLAAGIVVAVAFQRRKLARVELSEQASSWQGAASPPPLPLAVRNHPRWRTARTLAATAFVGVCGLIPLLLSPAADVRYGTAAALCLAAVAVSVAWAFAGQVALGHWGLAALGAAVTAVTPGPFVLRAGAAFLVVAGLGVILGLVDRRPGGMVRAVAGLAVAVAAPVAMLALGQVALGKNAQGAAMLGGTVTAVITIGALWLRNRRWGTRLVAARDNPRRAPSLGIDPLRARLFAMGLSAGLAGLAGAVYIASVPAGLAPGAFAADRSLELLAYSVIGGLGAPLGAALGTATLILGAAVLPSPWAALTTGAGVLIVVLFVPSGLSRALSVLRDAAARVLVGTAAGTTANMVPVPADTPSDPAEGAVAQGALDIDIVAGSDTHAALSTPTVRAAMVAGFCVAGPALAVVWGLPAVLRGALGIAADAAGPWIVLATAAAAVGTAVLAARKPVDPASRALPPEVSGLLAAAASAVVITWLGDAVLAGIAAAPLALAGGWVIGRLIHMATAAVVPVSRAAAAGLISVTALSGALGAVQLTAVGAADGLLAALPWAAAYLAAAAVAFQRSAVRLRDDAATAASRAPRRLPGRMRAGTLSVANLTVSYGAAPVLQGATLDVRPGELLALVGGNGSGKSTLLRAIAGLVPAASGQIRLAGQDLTILRADSRAVAGVALVSGAHPVFAGLTVRDNLRVGAYLTHRTQAAFDAATEHVLALVPTLAGRLETRAGLLSGGEQRQLGLAQTLYRRPAILLADELTLGLDAAAQHATLVLLRAFAQDGVGVVVVDHDLASLLPCSDRAVVLADGAAITVDDPQLLDAARRQGVLQSTFLAGART